MKLSSDKVKKVAQLSNLSLTSGEEEKYATQLSKILDYIGTLDSAKTQAAEPTYNVTDLSNILAEDEVRASLPREKALQNASSEKNSMFTTKGVFGEE